MVERYSSQIDQPDPDPSSHSQAVAGHDDVVQSEDRSLSSRDIASTHENTDRTRWLQLAQSTDPEDFYQAWLSLQCEQLSGVISGLLLAETGVEKTFAPSAVWPEQTSGSAPLVDVAKAAMEEGEAVLEMHLR